MRFSLSNGRKGAVLAGFACFLLCSRSLVAGAGHTSKGNNTMNRRQKSEARLVKSLLRLSDEARARFEEGRARGLIEIAPVHLPDKEHGNCNHYGWPIATMVKDSLIVMHRRIPGHNPKGSGGPHPSMTYGLVLRSEDGGQTWSEPYDLRDCMSAVDRKRNGRVPLSHRFKFDKEDTSGKGYKVHLHAIGTTLDGAVVAINNHGVFRSEDEGRTWKHFSRALRDDTFKHELVNLGPRLIDHPRYGLMAFGNWFGNADPKPSFRDAFVALTSRNGGARWAVKDYDLGFSQYEPAALLHRDRLLLVTRDQEKKGRNKHWQIEWQPGRKPRVIDTNLADPKLVDTVDFSLNPVTKRFEVVRSERYRMQLWLWSMDPRDWKKGEWTRECRLLGRKRPEGFYSVADGYHPAGAVLDVKRGVQHIFIYSGHPNGPSGVFRITRTLDTPKLVAFLGGE